MRKWWKSESGQSAFLFVLILVVLIGMLALVVDYGMPALTTRKLQNAADSAALAAASKLPAYSTADEDAVKAEAIDYALKNGFSDADVTLEKSSGSSVLDTVTVTAHFNVSYSFAKIFGLTSVDLERSASAQIKAVSSLRGVVPLSIEKGEMDAALDSGNYYMTLKFGGGSGTNGAYGALDLDGSNGGGASDYRDRLVNGYDGIITVGSSVPTENGNMSGPTEKGVQQRYNACTHYTGEGGCTPEHYDKNCPRVMLIPVVVYNSAHSVTVKGFAPFLLDSYHGSGNECFVYGTYLPSFVVDGSDTSGSVSAYGPYTVRLVG